MISFSISIGDRIPYSTQNCIEEENTPLDGD